MADHVRVLHVDDDPAFLDLAVTFLERADSRLAVEPVTAPAEALDRLADGSFDCVVSDYDMPGQTGLELLGAVRELDPALPFILYTGEGSETLAGRAINEGVTDYVRKRSGRDHYSLLANRIQNAVERYRAVRAADRTRKRLAQLAVHGDDVRWMVAPDWSEVLFVDAAYEEIWGRSVEALRADASDFLRGVHPDDRGAVERAMAQLSAGEPVELAYRVNAAEDFGRRVWSEGTPITDADGTVERIVGVLRDLTHRPPVATPVAGLQR